jgi:hypothetical protein
MRTSAVFMPPFYHENGTAGQPGWAPECPTIDFSRFPLFVPATPPTRQRAFKRKLLALLLFGTTAILMVAGRACLVGDEAERVRLSVKDSEVAPSAARRSCESVSELSKGTAANPISPSAAPPPDRKPLALHSLRQQLSAISFTLAGPRWRLKIAP